MTGDKVCVLRKIINAVKKNKAGKGAGMIATLEKVDGEGFSNELI